MTQEELDSTPICSEHADTWYCARNHIKTDTGCILCDLAIANKTLLILATVNVVRRNGETAMEQVADWKAHAKAKLDAEQPVLTIEVSDEQG